MIVILIVSLLFGGSSGDLPGKAFFSHLLEFVEENISDEARQEEATSLIKEMNKESKKYAKELKKLSKKIAKLNKDYLSDRTQFEVQLNDLNTKRMNAQQKLIDLRFMLKDKLTSEEWKTAFQE